MPFFPRSIARVSTTVLISVFVTIVAGGCDSRGEAELRRAQRAEQQARNLALAAGRVRASEAFGQEDAFLEAVRIRWDQVRESGPFFETSDGWIRSELLKSYLLWNEPTEPGGPPFAEDAQAEGHPLPAIVRYASDLRARGIDLLCVPVPSRLDARPELVASLTRTDAPFTGMNPGYFRFLQALTREGVDVLDLLSVFVSSANGEPLFLKYDHHWSPRGIEVAAEELATRIAAYPWFERGPVELGRDFQTRTETIDFLAEVPQRTRYEPQVERLKITRVLSQAGELLEVIDRASPILVLGDSNVNFMDGESTDLLRHLLARLGWRFDAIGIPAGATDQVWRAVQRRGDGLAGKKLVVWIFSVGRLPVGRLDKRRWKYTDPFAE